MSAFCIANVDLIGHPTLTGRGWLRAEDGRISAVAEGDCPHDDALDGAGMALLPGFIDLHVHGAAGHDVMDATAQALTAIARFKARHGVTSWLPTTLTDSRERLDAALSQIAALVGQDTGGAQILGAHLEGPYLNRDKAGAQNPEHIRRADRDEALSWLDLNVIRLLAIAPEFEANHWLMREAAERGVTVSAAHTDATAAQFAAGVALGLRHATHTGNAMRGIHHREIGTLGAALLDERVRCEVIADGVHLAPEMVALIYKAIGPQRLILITDAMRAAGMPDGTTTLGNTQVTVKEGQARLADGTLAGSVLTMDRALHSLRQATGQPLTALWPTSSRNAAQVAGVADHKGQLSRGYDADLALLDADGQVHMTVVGGVIVHQA